MEFIRNWRGDFQAVVVKILLGGNIQKLEGDFQAVVVVIPLRGMLKCLLEIC